MIIQYRPLEAFYMQGIQFLLSKWFTSAIRHHFRFWPISRRSWKSRSRDFRGAFLRTMLPGRYFVRQSFLNVLKSPNVQVEFMLYSHFSWRTFQMSNERSTIKKSKTTPREGNSQIIWTNHVRYFLLEIWNNFYFQSLTHINLFCSPAIGSLQNAVQDSEWCNLKNWSTCGVHEDSPAQGPEWPSETFKATIQNERDLR